MPEEVRTPIRAIDLVPGQFFFIDNRWYRAAGVLVQHEGKTPQIKAASPVTGETEWMWLPAQYVTVNEGNAVPVTFQPNTLMRKVQVAREKAARQARMADLLECLAIDIRLSPTEV
jgi:hypothetical protein